MSCRLPDAIGKDYLMGEHPSLPVMAKVRKRVGINPEHQQYLEENPNFNFSAFVREKIDEKMRGDG